MEEKIISRLFTYLQEKNIPHTRFEKEIGLSNGYLKTQLRRNSDLGESVIRKVIDNCLDIDICWLLTGRPPMLRSETSPLMGEQAPISTLPAAEASVYCTMYKEERAKAESQAEQIGVLKQTIRQLEEKIEGLQSIDAENASDNEDARDVDIADVG
ncbi:MAG: transcriptional regulator [Parabacteroides sp.]|nr:transcriptional regulator [Parabacteroides sp.]